MTNPAAAMRMLITYAICIPMAIFVGYLLTNPLDYGTLGFLGVIIALIISPVFIKWHYPILVFGLVTPAYCFFLPGKPPLGQVVVIMSLGISIVERALSSERRFVSVPVMTWPLLFIAAMVYMTAELTGGIGLHSLGGDVGGGRKYITMFVGVAVFFALTSRVIPPERRNLYFMLFFLPPFLGVIASLFPFLPSPLNYINLLFPPAMGMEQEMTATTRFTSLSFAVGAITALMLARYNLRGIFLSQHPWRAPVFICCILMSMLGGYRASMVGLMMNLVLLFFMEGLHRTRLMMVMVLFGVLAGTIMVSFSDHLPYTFQRSMAFLPLKWNPEVILDTEGSSEWRYKIWRDTWPKVPDHLLLGKGYSLSKEDYDMIGEGTFAHMGASMIDSSQEGLALSGDYHSGPLSALMTFGIWGGISIIWLMSATGFVLYRNYRYGVPELRTLNLYLFVSNFTSFIAFIFIFGSFGDAVGGYATVTGFSIAMNGGVGKPAPRPASNPRIKPLPSAVPQPA